jgi:hypothetical protein
MHRQRHLGDRIQAVYARAVGVTDRYSSLLPSLRQWAAEADQAVWLSAGQTGGASACASSPTATASSTSTRSW